jgi:hypothetical protein
MATDRDRGGSAAVEAEIVDGNVAVAPSAMEAMVRGEIDVQIATAKRYPRSLELFQKRAIAMATIDEDTAESCIYRRPVGKKKGANGKWEEEFAEGMSVRMAEIVGACYGNLRVYATLVEQPNEYVRTRGMAIDLETNFASSSEVIESTLKQDGTPYSPRMRVVVAKATLSKARRDATFQVVPKALAKPIETAVRHILLGTAETLEKRRQKVTAWISKLGIEEARVYAAVGIEGPADLTAEKLEILTGLRTAIKDGEHTIEEVFPPLTADQRDHLTEELALVEPETAKKLKSLFVAKAQSKGQALAFLRQYKDKLPDLIAVLEAIPASAVNRGEEPQRHEARSRETPSAAAGPVGGSTSHGSPATSDKPASPSPAPKKFEI